MEKLELPGVIYKITSPTGKVYIGQTRNLNRRMRDYSKLKCTSQVRLFNSLKSHGFEKHRFECLYFGFITDEELEKMEAEFIAQYDSTSTERGLNVLASGKRNPVTASAKRPMSEETKKAIGDANRGKKRTPFMRAVLSANNAMHHVEHREKMRESVKQAMKNPEVRRKISETKRLQMSQGSPQCKAVIKMDMQGNVIERYHSARYAAELNKTYSSRITEVCRGIRIQHKGFLWRYE